MDELSSGFSETTIELLLLSSSLDPRDNFKYFDADKIYALADKYRGDFSTNDMRQLQYQLLHYEVDVVHHEKFQNMSTISELCRALKDTHKNETYNMVDRLIRLVLTLPVFTASSERAFSAMKHVKSTLRNYMENAYLTDSLVVYIKRAIAKSIDFDSVIESFEAVKHRRILLR